MKPTKNFKDGFQKTLTESGFWTSNNIAQTWNPNVASPPYKGMTGSTGNGLGNMSREEQNLPNDGDIPTNLPFPLGNITEYLANVYIELLKAETSIKTCIDQNVVVTGERRSLLQNQLKAINEVKVQIKEISKNIERLSLNV